MHLTDLKLAPQPASLFAIPKGLREIPYDALALLLNMRLKPRR
jgi:hypothetical protein